MGLVNPPIIVDLIGEVVDRMKVDPDLTALRALIAAEQPQNMDLPYYLFGHRGEINDRLLEKSSDSVYQYQRYPCVALRLDIVEDANLGMFHFSLNLAILAFTAMNYSSEDRLEKVFRPILYPLYASFLKNVKQSGLFSWDVKQFLDVPPHRKVDRYYYGTSTAEGNVKHVFSDPIDAIEIMDLKINARANKC